MFRGQSITFNYTGGVQQIELDAGIYTLEAYGASGGGSSVGKHTAGSQGGLGGYTKATLDIQRPIILYIYVGGAGKYGVSGNSYGGPKGGWNGGGNGGNSSSGSGGGATDFRIKDGAWNNVDSLRSRILVAGGAGGADNGGSSVGGGDDGSGGSGGGLSGQGAWIDGRYNAAYGGTQTSGGGFGYGQNVGTNTDTGGAGGGYWGGKVTNHNNGGAGGGSSYIKGYPGCDVTYKAYQGDVVLTEGVIQQGVRNGNGYAVISCKILYDNKRVNSNFYKNVNPESIYEYQDFTRFTHQVYQENHGLQKGDPIYFNETYKKTTIDISRNVIGIVSNVVNENVFEYQTSGLIKDITFANPGEILYLNENGVSFKSAKIVKPLGYQTLNGIMVNIQTEFEFI